MDTMNDSNDRARLLENLAYVFRGEWSALGASYQALIVRDCTEDGGVSDLRTYQRAIGCGNLRDYAQTMRARFSPNRCHDCGSTFTIDDEAEVETRREVVSSKTGVARVEITRRDVIAAFCNGCERVEVL